MTVIIITGTPATGKTTLANLIHSRFGYLHVDAGKLAAKFAVSYDQKRQTSVVDVKPFVAELVRIIKSTKQDIVIDSHLSHYVGKKYVDLCLVTKCSLKVLRRRLMARYKNLAKVRENLDAEIFDICYNEALEFGHKVIVVDTTKSVNIGSLKDLLCQIKKQ